MRKTNKCSKSSKMRRGVYPYNNKNKLFKNKQIDAIPPIKNETIDMKIEKNDNMDSYVINETCLDIKSEYDDDSSSNAIDSLSNPIDPLNISETITMHETERVSNKPYIRPDNDEEVLLLVVEDEHSSSDPLSESPDPIPSCTEKEVSITCADCDPPVHFKYFKDFKVHIAENHNRKHVFGQTKNNSSTNHELPPSETTDSPSSSMESNNSALREPLKTYSNKIKLKVTYACPFCTLSEIESQDLLDQHIELIHRKKCEQINSFKVEITSKNMILKEPETKLIPASQNSNEKVKRVDKFDVKQIMLNKMFLCPICDKSGVDMTQMQLTTFAKVWHHFSAIHLKILTIKQVEAFILENSSYLRDFKEEDKHVETIVQKVDQEKVKNVRRQKRVETMKNRLALIKNKQKKLLMEKTYIEKQLRELRSSFNLN